ncbi:MAG: endonuclease/exonuclease/phosphatase family protein [Flavobacteriales bacterium]|nr:endonuclease/exonuclease/phosphatase family protein [Flavobacteriales bacterium]
MKKITFLSKLFFIFNLVVALLLFGSYAAPFVNPSSFSPIAFLGLAFPYLFIANVIFLVYWLVRSKVYLLLSLSALVFSYSTIPNYIQFNSNSTEVFDDEIKVLSFNVRVFDLYMWSNEKTTRNKIFDLIHQEQPDVLCLQEFYQADTIVNNYDFKTLDTLTQFLKANNYHVEYTTTLREVNHWGIITFSKYPIVGKGIVPFALKDDNICIYTDIQKGDQTIRVYNAHLASIKLDKHDYKAMQKINHNEYSDNFDNELMMIEKIRYGFVRRSFQADSIQKSIANSPYPVILCGDFNDTPSSYAYHTILGDLKDAFVESGSGLGRTYIGEFPSYRIDYIFYDSQFESISYQTHPEKLSDHHPISARIRIKE